MTALDVIRMIYAHDGKLTIEGDALKVFTPTPLPDDLRQALREHKPAIMVAMGAPLDTVINAILGDIRPQLPRPLRGLPDDKLLALVNWSIMAAWQRSLRGLEEEMAAQQKRTHP